jgi:hypothetical protein
MKTQLIMDDRQSESTYDGRSVCILSASWQPEETILCQLVHQLKGLNNIVAEYDPQIETRAKTQRYEKSVQTLIF